MDVGDEEETVIGFDGEEDEEAEEAEEVIPAKRELKKK